MPFNANIPLANDRLAKSQQDLLNNNKQLDTSFGINHYTFSDLTANNGMHKFVQLVNQPAIPPGLVNGAETLYAKATAGLGELYYTRGNTGTEIQMTSGNVLAATSGYTFLPGGLLLIFGTKSAGSGGTYSVTFPNSLTLSAVPYSVQVTSDTFGAAVTVSSTSTTGFSGNKSNASQTIYWMAIGPGAGP